MLLGTPLCRARVVLSAHLAWLCRRSAVVIFLPIEVGGYSARPQPSMFRIVQLGQVTSCLIPDLFTMNEILMCQSNALSDDGRIRHSYDLILSDITIISATGVYLVSSVRKSRPLHWRVIAPSTSLQWHAAIVEPDLLRLPILGILLWVDLALPCPTGVLDLLDRCRLVRFSLNILRCFTSKIGLGHLEKPEMTLRREARARRVAGRPGCGKYGVVEEINAIPDRKERFHRRLLGTIAETERENCQECTGYDSGCPVQY
jgi:hypothetical protein